MKTLIIAAIVLLGATAVRSDPYTPDYSALAAERAREAAEDRIRQIEDAQRAAEWRAARAADRARQEQRQRDYDARSEAPYSPSVDPSSGAGLWNKYYGAGSPYAPTRRPYRGY